tara:strand:+ start:117 stop:728 length:612 start_codon:yes stop_codon:yes gene_type:complete
MPRPKRTDSVLFAKVREFFKEMLPDVSLDAAMKSAFKLLENLSLRKLVILTYIELIKSRKTDLSDVALVKVLCLIFDSPLVSEEFFVRAITEMRTRTRTPLGEFKYLWNRAFEHLLQAKLAAVRVMLYNRTSLSMTVIVQAVGQYRRYKTKQCMTSDSRRKMLREPTMKWFNEIIDTWFENDEDDSLLAFPMDFEEEGISVEF